MDAILEIPMREVIEGLALDVETRTLLLENKGRLFPIYELMLMVEASIWPAIEQSCHRIGLPTGYVAQCHWNAMEWAQQMVTCA